MSNKKITRKGSGRTTGSFSFVKIKMADLKSRVGDEAECIVSRKWAEQLGFTNIIAAPAKELIHSVEGTTLQTKATVNVVDFDKDVEVQT